LASTIGLITASVIVRQLVGQAYPCPGNFYTSCHNFDQRLALFEAIAVLSGFNAISSSVIFGQQLAKTLKPRSIAFQLVNPVVDI